MRACVESGTVKNKITSTVTPATATSDRDNQAIDGKIVQLCCNTI